MPFCTPRGALPATLGIDGGPCFHGTRLPTNPAHACPLPTNYRLTRLILGAKSLSTRDRTYCRPPCAPAVSPVGHSGASVSVCKARTRPAGREFSVFQNFAQTLFPGLTCSGREIELGHVCLALLPLLFRFPRGHGCMIDSPHDDDDEYY